MVVPSGKFPGSRAGPVGGRQRFARAVAGKFCRSTSRVPFTASGRGHGNAAIVAELATWGRHPV